MNTPPLRSTTWETLLDWIFPPKCGGCGKAGQWLCADCRSQIHYVKLRVNEEHPPYPWGDAAVQRMCSVAWHEEPLRSAIHNFKYRGQKALRKPLAELLVEHWRTLQMPVDLIVAVPLHPKREKERGYNQSQLLADEFSRSTGIPAAHNGLRRVRHTLPQVSLNMQQRWQNVNDAFQGDPKALADKRILLIDDVCTTGATLEACGRAALAAGAQSVWAITVARPRDPWSDMP
jgi:ComF family protein